VSRWRHWRDAFFNRRVWIQALKIGAPVGILQALLNQGDVWLAHAVTWKVVAKTILSPLLSMSIALVSAAGVVVHKNIRTERSYEPH
jgi:hypothetical protein